MLIGSPMTALMQPSHMAYVASSAALEVAAGLLGARGYIFPLTLRKAPATPIGLPGSMSFIFLMQIW